MENNLLIILGIIIWLILGIHSAWYLIKKVTAEGNMTIDWLPALIFCVLAPIISHLSTFSTFQGKNLKVLFKHTKSHEPRNPDDLDEEIPGLTGEIVDLFNKELTQQEWDALCIIHRLRLRLNLGIRFDWSRSIDVKSETTSQIVDEDVFLNKESSNI